MKAEVGCSRQAIAAATMAARAQKRRSCVDGGLIRVLILVLGGAWSLDGAGWRLLLQRPKRDDMCHATCRLRVLVFFWSGSGWFVLRTKTPAYH